MDHQQLTERLEARTADVPVGPPPLEAMRATARRRRRLRGWAGAAAAVVAVATIATGTALWPDGADPDAPVAADPRADTDAPPAGHRYVGVGAAVIAVPDSWGTNETECGTPLEDTVIIDQGAICMALVPRPAQVESVTIRFGHLPPADLAGWTRVEVDGEAALRSSVALAGGVRTGSVFVPAYDALFVAESSSPEGAEVVPRLLDSITILGEHTTVPGFQDLAFDQVPATMSDSYVDRLHELGLTAEVVVRDRSPFDPGTVLGVRPAAGSVVAPGDTVRVTVAP